MELQTAMDLLLFFITGILIVVGFAILFLQK